MFRFKHVLEENDPTSDCVFVQNETQSSRAFVVNGLTIFRLVQSFPGHLVRGKSQTGTR